MARKLDEARPYLPHILGVNQHLAITLTRVDGGILDRVRAGWYAEVKSKSYLWTGTVVRVSSQRLRGRQAWRSLHLMVAAQASPLPPEAEIPLAFPTSGPSPDEELVTITIAEIPGGVSETIDTEVIIDFD